MINEAANRAGLSAATPIGGGSSQRWQLPPPMGVAAERSAQLATLFNLPPKIFWERPFLNYQAGEPGPDSQSVWFCLTLNLVFVNTVFLVPG